MDSNLWIIKDSILPTISSWFICYVDGNRMPLRYNVYNLFWVDLSGKCYQPNQIDKWLNA